MVATALWSGVQALNAEARDSYAQAAALLGQGEADRLEPARADGLPAEAHGRLRRAGWPVSPVIEDRVEAGGRGLRLLGVDPFTLPPGPIAAALRREGETEAAMAPADFLARPWRTLVAPETLAALGADPGEPIESRQGALPPAVPAPGLAPGTLVMDISAAAALTGRGGEISYLILSSARAAPPGDPSEIAGVPLRRVTAAAETDLDRLTRSFHLNLTAFGFLAFVVGIFIVHAAVGLAFEQRLPLYRTLRATGVSARELAGLVLAELAGLALLAGLAGTALGQLMAAALLPDVAASLRGLYGARVAESLGPQPLLWLAGLGMSLAGALLAAGRSLLRLWRMPVLAGAGRAAWAGAAARGRAREVAGGLALLAVGGMAWALGDSLAAGFAVIAALLLGSALLLPAALGAIAWIGARAARRPMALWFWADARQQLPGLSLALVALLLALAANIGVGTMVESFRTTFTGWLDQRLFADVYVDAGQGARVAEMRGWLAARPGVETVLETREAETTMAGWPVDVVGRPDDAAYRARWPLLDALPGAWDRVAAGEGAMLSEQLARRLGVGLGDRVTLPAPAGPWRLEVAALYADYGNPRGEIGVALAEMRERWPGAEHGGFGLIVAGGAADRVMEALAARFDLGPREMVDQGSLKGLSTRIFEQTFAVTAALNALTLAVAGIALFAGLAMLADMRLPQLAPLWAMGVTRRRLAWLELSRTVAMAGLTAVLALPLGLLLAWVLVAVVQVQAFGWRLPLHLFPGQWASLGTLALTLAAAAGALPALRLARMPPARLLKLFAEDR
jgi:putative ABC transport system permease protein